MCAHTGGAGWLVQGRIVLLGCCAAHCANALSWLWSDCLKKSCCQPDDCCCRAGAARAASPGPCRRPRRRLKQNMVNESNAKRLSRKHGWSTQDPATSRGCMACSSLAVASVMHTAYLITCQISRGNATAAATATGSTGTPPTRHCLPSSPLALLLLLPAVLRAVACSPNDGLRDDSVAA